MALRPIKIVAGNTAPPYVFTLKRNGTAIDVTGAAVNLILTAPDGTITNAGHQACVLVTAASGIVKYTAHQGDMEQVGTYKGDAQIVYNDGTKEILFDVIKWKARATSSGVAQ